MKLKYKLKNIHKVQNKTKITATYPCKIVAFLVTSHDFLGVT